MSDYKIGENFEYNGKMYFVSADYWDCDFCDFNKRGDCIRGFGINEPLCTAAYRDDKTDVVFLEVDKKTHLERAIELAKETYPETEYGNEIREAFVEGYLKRIQDEEKEYE